MGSIPGQGTYLVAGLVTCQGAYERQQVDVSLPLPLASPLSNISKHGHE